MVKLARYFACTDRYDEALSTVSRSMRLNPPHPGWYRQEQAIVEYGMGDYRKSIASYYKNSDLGGYDLALIVGVW